MNEQTFIFLEPVLLTKFREQKYRDSIDFEQKPSEIIKLMKMLKYTNDQLKRDTFKAAKKEIINCIINN